MPLNAFLAEILPFFPVTFLVVTTINMLTFGILGSFQIHRKTMIDLGALAVIGIQERPYLAHNFNSYHREKTMTLPLYHVFDQNLAVYGYFCAFSVTFLVVTVINMLALLMHLPMHGV